MDVSNQNDLVDRIIAEAFEHLDEWRRPTSLKSVGPAFPEVYPRFEEQLCLLRQDIRRALSLYSVEELRSEYPNSLTAAFNPLFDPDGRHGRLAKRLAKLKKTAPQDFVGGWSVKGKELDIAHWRGFTSFSLAEATLLSVGRDPRLTNYDSVFQGYGRSEEADELLYFLEDRYEAIANGLGVNPEDSTTRVDAGRLIGWILYARVQVDERFRRMVLAQRRMKSNLPNPVAAALPGPDSGPLHRSSLKIHARMITAVAITKYGLTDERGIRRAATSIQNDADLLGLGFDERVLINLLRLGLQERGRVTSSLQ